MNICIVNNNYRVGGVQRVTIELANCLQEHSHEVTLIDFSGDNVFYFSVNENINIPNSNKLLNLKRKIKRKISRLKSDLFKKPINDYDLYKEQSYNLIKYLKQNNHDVLIVCQGLLTSFIPLIKKELPNLRIVSWQHSEFDILINKYYKNFKHKYKLGIEHADLVVCLTEADRVKFSKINKKSTCIYNPLTINTNNQKISKLDKKQIIFVGRLEIETKGLDYLIEIGNNLKKDWRILVAGDGTDKQRFAQLIKENNLEDKIILKGSLKSEELVELYSSGSIFISTSRWEGFGLVLTEAMVFGLPIISFDNLGPREILKNGEFGILIEKNDINEFLSNLDSLIEDPKKRIYYQNKSLERFKDFKMKKIIEIWESKIKELL